jgi:hypothetical protein
VSRRRIKAIMPPMAPPIIALVRSVFIDGPDGDAGKCDGLEADGVMALDNDGPVLGRATTLRVGI